MDAESVIYFWVCVFFYFWSIQEDWTDDDTNGSDH